jgi:branched-chain amino acid transport system permease protein
VSNGATDAIRAMRPRAEAGSKTLRQQFARWFPVVGWVLLAALIAMPAWGTSRYLIYLGTLIALQASLATSLNIVVGYAGQFALAHAAFYGFGAYASALMVTSGGLDFWITVPLTMLAAGAVACAIGYPALRYTGGVHFALLTFAFGELARLCAANWHSVTGGPMGMRIAYSPSPIFGIDFSTSRGLYWVAVGVFLMSLAAAALVQRSRFGRALVAIREDETLASFLGIDVLRHKLLAFIVSAMLAALAGTVYAPFMTFISPDMMSASEVISMIGVLIVGGIGTLAGPIIGTLIFFGVPELLRVAKLYRLVVLGVVIVLSVLFVPSGIAGVVRERLRRLGK